MNKYATEDKLNNALLEIEKQLKEKGNEELNRWYNEFNIQPDYNLVEYGTMLFELKEIQGMYIKAGFVACEVTQDIKLWEMYRRHVGYVTRALLEKEQ